jgi:hypothetical protein
LVADQPAGRFHLKADNDNNPEFTPEEIAWLRQLWNEGEASAIAGTLDIKKIIASAKQKLAERHTGDGDS